jgi:hypothetical protein
VVPTSSPISAVNIRRLPDGRDFHGIERGWNGLLFAIEVDDPLFAAELLSGALVECTSHSHVYFGVVKEIADGRIIVVIEHSIERAQLEPINDTWG